jgi:excisionase family DNA binding protein
MRSKRGSTSRHSKITTQFSNGRAPTDRGECDVFSTQNVAPDHPHEIPEVSTRLGCSQATTRRRIASGALRAVKHGRILRILEADLQAFIQASRRWR